MRENFIHKFHFLVIFEMSTGVADIYEPVLIQEIFPNFQILGVWGQITIFGH